MSTVTELKRDISSLRSELRKVKGEFGLLRRRKGIRRTEDVADSDEEEKSSPDVDPEELKRLELEREKRENFRKLQEATKDPAFWDKLPSYHSVPSIAPLSSSSGSTAPTEYPWESAEDEVS